MSPHRILLATLALPLLTGCGECGKPASPSRAETTAPIAVRTIALTRATGGDDTLPATIRATRRAELAPRIAGTWREVLVAVGDAVEGGRALARIHAPEWSARRDAAEAAVAAAKADFTRSERLIRADAATPAEHDAATARLRTAEAALAEARALNEETALVAPYAGVIVSKSASVGEAALPGQTALVLEDPTALEVETALPESLAPSPRVGDPLTAEVRGVTLRLALTEVAPAADAAGRTRTVRAAIPPEALKRLPAPPAPGEFARVSVATAGGAGDSRLLAPAEAIVRRGQLESVWVREDGKAALRLVRTGRATGADVEILSGLTGTETLLTPSAGLREGAPVK